MMQKHERAIKKLKDELALLLEEIKNMQARINQLEREIAIEEAEQVEQEYRRVSDQLTALQLTLDRANLLLEFEVELEG